MDGEPGDEIDSRVAFVKHCTETLRQQSYQQGRDDKQKQILDLMRPCLDRDPTLQKVVKAIEELE